MTKLNNLSLKSLVVITFLIGVVTGGSLFFLFNYSPPAEAGDNIEFKAEAYQDVVRFRAEGGNVSRLQVEIYDLSGRKIYQGETTRQALDWNRTSSEGERLNKGTYLYVTKAYSGGNLVKRSGVGKMFVSPESVQLKSAPSFGDTIGSNDRNSNLDGEVQPQDTVSGDLYVQGGLAYVEQVDYPQFVLSSSLSGAHEWSTFSSDSGFSIRDRTDGHDVFKIANNSPANFFALTFTGARISNTSYPQYIMRSSLSGAKEWSFFGSDTGFYIRNRTNADNVVGIRNGAPHGSLFINSAGKVGIGHVNPDAQLEVRGSSSNLLAVYNKSDSTSSAKFRVENDGTVRADGAYYGSDFKSGGADVAERINTSEWVEKGNVVEIDPSHEGFFRKTKDSYSKKVAGVISSNPGVILGNDKGSSGNKGKWNDNRPMLALAGRIPVKVNNDNGPIHIGDLLVSSSQPGYAMKCENNKTCTGAVIGKALEPLEKKSGEIMAQVTLS